MANKLRSVVLLAGAFILLQVPAWAQCVMCGTALASSPEGQALAGSFRYGILLLLVAPYIILGSIAYAVFRAYKKRSENRELWKQTGQLPNS
jgi:hypothetical protein